MASAPLSSSDVTGPGASEIRDAAAKLLAQETDDESAPNPPGEGEPEPEPEEEPAPGHVEGDEEAEPEPEAEEEPEPAPARSHAPRAGSTRRATPAEGEEATETAD